MDNVSLKKLQYCKDRVEYHDRRNMCFVTCTVGGVAVQTTISPRESIKYFIIIIITSCLTSPGIWNPSLSSSSRQIRVRRHAVYDQPQSTKKRKTKEGKNQKGLHLAAMTIYQTDADTVKRGRGGNCYTLKREKMNKDLAHGLHSMVSI